MSDPNTSSCFAVQPELGLAMLGLFIWQYMKHTEQSPSAIAQRPPPLPSLTAVPVPRYSREAERVERVERAERPRAAESGGASSKPARKDELEKRLQYEQAKAAKRAEAQRSERAADEQSTRSPKIPGGGYLPKTRRKTRGPRLQRGSPTSKVGSGKTSQPDQNDPQKK